MKFYEKLQKLRKDNKLSQEQLADMLNVSRQSVSKWESGQTYPEMDKLIMMTKIFKCSLDYLVNEDVIEMEIKEKTPKSSISNFMDGILDIINRTVNMIKNMSGMEIFKLVIELLIIFLVLTLFKKPFNYVSNLGSNLFYNFGNQAGRILSSVWDFLIEIGYFILFVITYIYIYKTAYLDKYYSKNKELNFLNREEHENKIEINNEEKHNKEISNKGTYPFLDFLVKILVFIVKFFIVFFSAPILFSLIFLAGGLILSIIFLFKGVFYFGIFFGIISLILLHIFYITLVFNFIFNKKNNVKYMLVLFLSGIVLVGISGGVLAYEMANTNYINSAPTSEKISVLTKEYDFNKDLIIESGWINNSYNYNIEYIKDETLGNKIKIEVNYYKDFINIDVIESNSNSIAINSSSGKKENLKDILAVIIKDLSKKEVYNYTKLFKVSVKVYGTSSNIDALRSNIDKRYQEINEENLQNQINEYERKLQEKENEINSLIEENKSLKEENEEYKNKIQEYKNRLNEILGL